jgi:uncharacterized protein (DUF2235 family)
MNHLRDECYVTLVIVDGVDEYVGDASCNIVVLYYSFSRGPVSDVIYDLGIQAHIFWYFVALS